MAGAVVAGKKAGGHDDFNEAAMAMARMDAKTYAPLPENQKMYDRLFALYKCLHDSFGVQGHQDSLFDVMKELLAIRDVARR